LVPSRPFSCPQTPVVLQRPFRCIAAHVRNRSPRAKTPKSPAHRRHRTGPLLQRAVAEQRCSSGDAVATIVAVAVWAGLHFLRFSSRNLETPAPAAAASQNRRRAAHAPGDLKSVYRAPTGAPNPAGAKSAGSKTQAPDTFRPSITRTSRSANGSRPAT